MNVTINEPVNYASLVLPGEAIEISAVANNVELQGKHYIRIDAVAGDETASDSAYYFVKQEVVTMPAPAGIKDGKTIPATAP